MRQHTQAQQEAEAKAAEEGEEGGGTGSSSDSPHAPLPGGSAGDERCGSLPSGSRSGDCIAGLPVILRRLLKLLLISLLLLRLLRLPQLVLHREEFCLLVSRQCSPERRYFFIQLLAIRLIFVSERLLSGRRVAGLPGGCAANTTPQRMH